MRLCNGCYGRLLSLYEIKAGTAADDQKAEELAAALLSAVTLDLQRQAESLFRISEKRAERLPTEAVRFIATAQYVAGQLQADPQLEWSPAVIGLCKAVEAEIVWRILRPLADRTSREDLSTDKNDRDLGRVAAFCAESDPEAARLSIVQLPVSLRELRSPRGHAAEARLLGTALQAKTPKRPEAQASPWVKSTAGARYLG